MGKRYHFFGVKVYFPEVLRIPFGLFPIKGLRKLGAKGYLIFRLIRFFPFLADLTFRKPFLLEGFFKVKGFGPYLWLHFRENGGPP